MLYQNYSLKDSNQSAREGYRQMSKIFLQSCQFGNELLKEMKELHEPINTYLKQIVPDIEINFKKYLDSKFVYLSYCLQVKF